MLSKESPTYFEDLFKNAKAFFFGMGREDLVKKMDDMINYKIEDIMGADIELVLYVYKNLPHLKAFTRSKNPIYADINIYKYTLAKWLKEIETFIFQEAIGLEGYIRFSSSARQWL